MTSPDKYRQELEHQLVHSGKLKTAYSFLHESFRRSFFDKWLKGGVLLLFEVFFYLMFLACSALTIAFLFYDPLSIEYVISESIKLSGKVDVKEVTEFMMVLKILAVILSLFWLMPGLLLRAIRKKNSLIDALTDVIEENVKIEEEREERIKSVLR